MVRSVRRMAQRVIVLASCTMAGCAHVEPEKKAAAWDVRKEEEVIRLTERVEKQGEEIRRLRSSLKTFLAPKTVAKVHKQVPVKRLRPKAATVPKDETENTEIIVDSSQENMYLYYRGLQLLEDRQYEQANEAFEDFLKANSEHVYADRAQYFVVEGHFLNKEFPLAILASNQLESRYPHSFRLAEALYKRAVAYQEMGQKQQALEGLKDWLERFPKHALVVSASKRLAELKVSRISPTPLLNHEPQI